MDGWIDDGWVDGWMDGWFEWMGGWLGGWVFGWVNGWMDRWMDRQMDDISAASTTPIHQSPQLRQSCDSFSPQVK